MTVSEPLALVTVAMAATCQGDFAKAVTLLEETQRRCTHGEPADHGERRCADQGECPRADQGECRCADHDGCLCADRGELWARAYGDYVLSIAHLGLGRVEDAERAARRSLEAGWRLRESAGTALALDQLAVIAAVRGDGHRTARLQGAAMRLWTTSGVRGPCPEGMSEPRTVAERTARQLLGDGAYDASFATGRDEDLDDTVAHALA
ncbi:hypothetical protein [Planomonospora venezuelensis]|uniref:Tetratricopeptide repeat protein n=1 Tax=Planomonospora venezuelensis TaxID=1999 RepID=A0A841CZK8_PLAVE|nr:hypothetical protein [Planomonospora venezuelensis]MBB5963832.1 hypothetical protein [Planomonospora venezuelensis]GIM99619.1 hypothetical protein Pve01_12780 [Planomonospora venezuelensis]